MMGRSSRVSPTRWVLAFLSVAVFSALVPLGAGAQNPQRNDDEVLQRQEYTTPPDTIAQAVLAPRYLNVTLSQISADRTRFLNEVGDGPVTMDRFSKPFHDLGGTFIDFEANRDRNLTIRSNVAIQLISATDGSVVEVQIPKGARVSGAKWSPDGSRVAFYVHIGNATNIYVADAGNGHSRKLTRTPVLATLSTAFDWSGDGRYVATVLVPDHRPPMPVKPAVPTGPRVKMTEKGQNRLRVFASLMATPYDEQLLEWDVTGQVALIDVKSRSAKKLGEPTMVRAVDVSPDGAYVRVTRMVKPFSYIVPVRQFGSVQEIWDAQGNVVATVREDKLDTGVRPGGPQQGGVGFSGSGNQSGPRNIAWRSDGAGLVYLEQEPAPEGEEAAPAPPSSDQEEEGRPARRKDRLILWAPPFSDSSKTTLYESNRRMTSARLSADMRIVFVSERQGKNVHTYAVYLDDTSQRYTLARYPSDDVYKNPGSLVGANGIFSRGGRFARFSRGASATADVMLSSDGEHAFLQGTVYDEHPYEVGPKSFIDRIEIKTGDKTRIYETGNDGVFERPLAVVDLDGGTLVVSRESKTEVPQSYLRNGDELTQLTHNVDYTPDLTRMPQQSFVVERPDGFRFRVNVNLPPGYVAGTRLPAMFWFYPREYEDQEAYDKGARTYNRNAFPNFGTRSMEYLVRLGYAVVEPDAPIVGPAGRQNNKYENDLRNNLSAVIDSLDARGLIDRGRLGIGGHSYGAFSTANAMVHTPFFKAGIAGDGNYNRTLTPLAFQNERRFLWDAKDVYLSMSPFLYANQLTGALLMYHGLHDQNVGTDPIHSPKMFHALNGLGKTAAMYLYPYEDHGPAARNTVLDLWARWTAWLDKYVKNAGAGKAAAGSDHGGEGH